MINYITSGLMCVCFRSWKKLLQSIFIFPSNVNDRQNTASERASNSKKWVDTNISVGKSNDNCYCCCHFYADIPTDTRIHEIARYT